MGNLDQPSVDEVKSENLELQAEATKLRKKLSDLESDVCCSVCLDRRKNIVLFPCSHCCVCRVCFMQIERNCPICRVQVKGHIQIKY